MSGKTCTLKWRSQRKWEGSRVVYEFHYDNRRTISIASDPDF
jgi:hypothetical protein